MRTILTRRQRTASSILALATVMMVGASPAKAQVAGSGSFGAGTGTINPGAGTVTLNDNRSVINWTSTGTVSGGVNQFLAPGNTLSFSGPTNFAVLNRVSTGTDMLGLNGTVNGTGGSIYFYNPNGIVAGGSSQFNVGSLVLTTLNITDANFVAGGALTFNQATNAASSVTLNGQVNALNTGSYVAIVAPRVVHNGTITTNGQAALVAAEAATINFSPDGLFDIAVDVGTTDANGVVISGSIGGAQSAGAGDNNRIYAVAVPKNQLMTMLINPATLGFNIAGRADVVGNAIVLSSGYNVTDGAANAVRASAMGAAAAANIQSSNLTTTSALTASAVDNNQFFVTSAVTMHSDVTIKGEDNAQLRAIGANADLTVRGLLTMSADQTIAAGQTGQAGNVDLSAENGGSIDAQVGAVLSANATGAAGNAAGINGANVTGGNINALGSAGTLLIGGDLVATANGIGGNTLLSGINAGSGTGGLIAVGAVDPTGSVTINGGLNLTANGTGGSGNAGNCFSCNGTAGFGRGGQILIHTLFDGGSISIGDDIVANANGIGGRSRTQTGRGDGGQISVTFTTDSTILLDRNVNLTATGTGGTSDETGGGYGKGGRVTMGSQTDATNGTLTVSGLVTTNVDGTGGQAIVIGSGGTGEGGLLDNGGGFGTVAFNAGYSGSAQGFGGDSGIGTGGQGLGGSGWVDAFGADVTITGDYTMITTGQGGDGVTGGFGRGGNVYLASSSDLTLTGSAYLGANGEGGFGSGGNGGLGQGGLANVRATGGGTNTITGDVEMDALGIGGGIMSGSGTAGSGDGGTVSVHAGQSGANPSTGTLSIEGSLDGDSSGIGGVGYVAGARSGSGFGAETHVWASANSSLTVGGSVTLAADGRTGNLECTNCSGGGDGTGGNLFISSNGTGSFLTFEDDLVATADGSGGQSSSTFAGGKGKGGSLGLHANNGGTTVVQAASLSASGGGGYDAHNTGGGIAEGGNANVAAHDAGTGSRVTVNGTLNIDAWADGGNSVGGAGGNNKGGVAGVHSAGLVTLNGNVSIDADASGGTSQSGAGGTASGGNAYVTGAGGNVVVNAALSIDGSATGGSGVTGGSATGLFTPSTNEVGPVAAGIYANNNGAVTVTGAVTMSSAAEGGEGLSGAGGSAQAGEAEVIAYAGNITLGGLNIDATATGGGSSNGAAGGAATGGFVDIAFGLGDAFVAGTINVGNALIAADATGGAGGVGVEGSTGGNGGAGGAAIGGEIVFWGSAAGGTLIAGSASLSATAAGGNGGAGGSGGTGGNGGAGGIGEGGYIFAGTVSATGAPGSGGDFTTTALNIDSSGFGGNGGAGGPGTTSGVGGNGGNGLGGSSILLIRGVDASAGVVALTASGTGGDGGTGATQGNGGIGRTGRLEVESKDRFGVPTQLGNLAATSITATATATGGDGAVAGDSIITGGSAFRISNGSASIGSVSFTITGNSYDDTAGTDHVSVRNGNATIVGAFSYNTEGELALDASNGTMTAGTLSLDAASFAANPASLPAPTVRGTYSATNMAIATGDDFITNANLVSQNAISINAPGAIGAANISSLSNVTLTATDGITAGNVGSGGNLQAQTNGAMTVGNLNASGTLLAGALGALSAQNVSGTGGVDLSSGANLVTANVTSANAGIRTRATGSTTLGVVTAELDLNSGSTGALSLTSAIAGQTIRLGSDASITSGNLTAGNSVVGTSGGAIQLGDVSAGLIDPSAAPGALFEVAMVTAGTLATGDISAKGDVQLAATGGITTGDIATDARAFAVSPGAISVGDVTIDDYLLIGGTGLFQYTGSLSVNSTFNARPTFNNFGGPGATSVTTGALTTGRIEIGASGNITTGAVDSTFSTRMISSAGNVLINGGVDSAAFISLIGVDVTTGALDSNSNIYLDADDALTIGALDAALWIGATATDIAVNGPISAGTYVNLLAYDDVATGNITAGTYARIEATGDLTFGTIGANLVEIDVGGTANGGNVTAASNVDIESGGAMVLGNVTTTGAAPAGEFSIGLVSATSIQTGTVTGTDRVGFATAGDLTTGAITGGSLILGLVGGDVVTGALTTASNGQVYIGNSSMYAAAGGGSEETEFDVDLVLGVNPVATGGSLTVNGAIDTPLFRVAVGEAISGGDIAVEGAFSMLASSITFGDITATGFIDLIATGAIVTGDLTAGGSVSLTGASVVTGNIQTNAAPPQQGAGFTTMDVGPGTPVEIFSDDDIVTGNITTSGYVGLYAADDITAGSINAGHDVIALAGGDASFGPITTPERFILAGYGNLDQLYGVETFDPELIFGLWPIESTGGNAIFAGSSNVGQSFQVYAGGNVVLNSLSVNGDEGFSGYIEIDSGGTIGIAGNVSSDYVGLTSRDINIAPTAQITATGVSFDSINPDGTYIGDNLPGTDGYRLTQAEIDRVDASFYGFDVLPGRGAAEMMMIGDLTLDLSGDGDDEGADFEIESDDDGEGEDQLRGIIRIVGDVTLTSSTDKTVYFTAKTIALDAATGSLSLTDGSGNLNGLIEFEANNIFVASGAIIDKLIENPRYDGHVAELNAPAAVQRPEGVLRAGGIIFNDEAQLENLAIQNTGTTSTPAGFLVLAESEYYDQEAGGDSDEDEVPAPGSINLVINGQLQASTGNLTGAAVRDALVEEYGSAEPFTANSTINGCPVSGGSCGSSSGGGLPPEAVITPTTITILASDPLGESFFGNEGDIAGDTGDTGSDTGSDTGGDEGGEDGGSASSPIDAPQPLFDTRPLNSDEDVNEPISGAGNPSLYGVSSDEDDEEDEEEDGKKSEPKPAKQTNARTGDGQ